MKNISESSDGNEQASRPTSTRNRNPARSSSEDATAGSQAAENKTGVRRRTPPSTPTANTPAPSAQHSRANTVASPQTQRPNGTPLPTQTRRVGNTATPVQRNGTAGATPHAQRPASTGHPTPGTGHRPSSPGSYAQRTGGPATPAPKPSTGSLQQRPASPTHSSKTVSRPGSSTGGTPRPTSPARPATPAPRPQERRVTAVKEKPTGPISIPPQIIVKDLAELLQTTPNEVIRSLIKHGVFASINQVVDYEKAAIIAQELGFEPSLSTVTAPAVTRGTHGLSANEAMMASRNEENMVVIPPVVTIMGHVDHGKTSLLDTIRKTKVAAGEAGGITQHIGAYQVEVQGKKITFLDTPGHEAFTAMRARGAQVTHIAIIVVAADDGVMPQTREAIDHAKAAKVPIIIALNKIDMASANPERVKQELADLGVVVTEYGGNVEAIPVSARTQEGVQTLLETIQLVSEAEVEPKANPDRPAAGAVIEAKMDKSRGAVATLLVQRGTLHVGDLVVAGSVQGRLKALFDDRGSRVKDAPPSFPVEVLGLNAVPSAGDRFTAVADERVARSMVEAATAAGQRDGEGEMTLEAVFARIRSGAVKELNLIVKADVQGSVEPITNSLEKIGDQTETRAK